MRAASSTSLRTDSIPSPAHRGQDLHELAITPPRYARQALPHLGERCWGIPLAEGCAIPERAWLPRQRGQVVPRVVTTLSRPNSRACSPITRPSATTTMRFGIGSQRRRLAGGGALHVVAVAVTSPEEFTRRSQIGESREARLGREEPLAHIADLALDPPLLQPAAGVEAVGSPQYCEAICSKRRLKRRYRSPAADLTCTHRGALRSKCERRRLTAYRAHCRPRFCPIFVSIALRHRARTAGGSRSVGEGRFRCRNGRPRADRSCRFEW